MEEIRFQTLVCVCVCEWVWEKERERALTCFDDILLHFPQSDYSPSLSAVLSAVLSTDTQKPIACPAHASLETVLHTHTHPPQQVCGRMWRHRCSGHNQTGSAQWKRRPKSNRSWFSFSVTDRDEGTRRVKATVACLLVKCVRGRVCVCVCMCVPELTGHRWSCQTIRGRGGQRRPPQLCCPSCPQWKATAPMPPSSSATLLPSSCNAKRCWNRWDECLSYIRLPLIQLSFRNLKKWR